MLCAQGIEVHGRWWDGAWQEVLSHPRLKDWMKEQLVGWRKKVLSTDEEQNALRERIAALAPAMLAKGVGAYSAAVLYYEMRGFERFTNRRQVGSMTGFRQMNFLAATARVWPWAWVNKTRNLDETAGCCP